MFKTHYVFVLLFVAIFVGACKNDDEVFEPANSEFVAPHVAYRASWNKCKFSDVKDFFEGRWLVISKSEGDYYNHRSWYSLQDSISWKTYGPFLDSLITINDYQISLQRLDGELQKWKVKSMKLHDKDLSVKIGRDTTLNISCIYCRIGDDDDIWAGVKVNKRGKLLCKLKLRKYVNDSFYNWCTENIPAYIDTEENFIMKFDYGEDFDMKNVQF